MEKFELTVAIALFIFNREVNAKKVFNEIAKAKPSKLFVVGDGPRAYIQGEEEKVRRTREIIRKVDWKCEVITNFSDNNMGCKKRVSSGLDWIFSQVDEAIILEDDCLPSPTFFRFCEEMLVKYRDNEKISMIGGGNFQFGKLRGGHSYYFSRYCHIWGWATWARAWKDYDVSIKEWPKLKHSNWLLNLELPKAEVRTWARTFQATYSGKIDTWDHQWTFANWRLNRLSIIPNVNLIENIGFGPLATHTHDENNKFSKMSISDIAFPLIHPNEVRCDAEADLFTSKTAIAVPLIVRLINNPFSIFKKVKRLFFNK
jgi:hypothetical protein